MAIFNLEHMPISQGGTQRAVLYWSITAWFYFLAVCTIWIQVYFGVVNKAVAIALSTLILAGTVPVYLLIRSTPQFKVATAQLAVAQAFHGIFCIALSYAVLDPLRAIALLPLPVIFLLCAFSVTRKTLSRLAVFAVIALSAAMVWLHATRPFAYSMLTDVLTLFAIANVLAAAVFLAGQFNALRQQLKLQKRELTLALASVQSLAFRDELTKLPNRRYMEELLVSEQRRHAQENNPLSVALLDIDYFKRVNDKYGYLVGDETLCKFAELLNASLRTDDVLARWGGEEFLLLLPKTDPNTAVSVVERLQGSVNEHNLQIGDEHLRITFSAGLAAVLPGGSSLEAVNFADKAMFEAKAAGRNAIRQFIPHTA